MATLTIEQVDGEWPDWAVALIINTLEGWTGDAWQGSVGDELLDLLVAEMATRL